MIVQRKKYEQDQLLRIHKTVAFFILNTSNGLARKELERKQLNLLSLKRPTCLLLKKRES